MMKVLLFIALLIPGVASAADRPNLLIILADDMGYGDLGCYGSQQIETPNLDQMAAAGVRCTDGYVSGNVCAPSRAGLLTGRYQERFGFEHNLNRRFPTFPERLGIPKGQRTIADHLKAAGYNTPHTPMQAKKGSFLEGGVRVPFIWHWSKGLPGGTTFREPFISLDLLPTFMAAAGAEMPPPQNREESPLPKRVPAGGILGGVELFLQHPEIGVVYTCEGARVRPNGTMSVHLMNMEAGGEAVLVTFARVGTVAQSFHPVVDGQVSRFSLVGNGRMTDSVTGSIWDAVTGECLSGPMQGTCLSVRSTGMARRDSRRILNS